MICNTVLEQKWQSRTFTLIAGIGTGPTDRIGDRDIRSPKIVVELLSVGRKRARKKRLELCKHGHGYGEDRNPSC